MALDIHQREKLDGLFSNANWLIFKEKRGFQLLMALTAKLGLFHSTAEQ